MPPAVDPAVVVVLRTDGRDGHEPRPHGENRQAVSRNPVLRRVADETALTDQGPCRHLQTYPVTEVDYELDADLPKTRHQQARDQANDLSVSVGLASRGAAQSSLVRRHHLNSDAAGLSISLRHHGLVYSEGTCMAYIEYD